MRYIRKYNESTLNTLKNKLSKIKDYFSNEVDDSKELTKIRKIISCIDSCDNSDQLITSLNMLAKYHRNSPRLPSISYMISKAYTLIELKYKMLLLSGLIKKTDDIHNQIEKVGKSLQ